MIQTQHKSSYIQTVYFNYSVETALPSHARTLSLLFWYRLHLKSRRKRLRNTSETSLFRVKYKSGMNLLPISRCPTHNLHTYTVQNIYAHSYSHCVSAYRIESLFIIRGQTSQSKSLPSHRWRIECQSIWILDGGGRTRWIGARWCIWAAIMAIHRAINRQRHAGRDFLKTCM